MSSFNFPVVITTAGVQPTAPATINTQFIADVAAQQPGYTVLPAGLIEDLSSTATGGIVMIDTARVELLNSLTPYGANAFLLAQMGAQTGIEQGTPVNTSVPVQFTGTVGFVVSPGFQVGDGTNTYQVVNGTVIGSGGTSPIVTAVAVASGAFAVPANTVTVLLTSVPGTVTLTVTNPVDGTPATSTESEQSYRDRVIAAQSVAAQGLPSYLKTVLRNVSGVVSRLVAVRVVLGTGFEVICGGGDTVEVAAAIYSAIFDPSQLTGSVTHPGDNVTVTILDAPDQYQIIYLDPPSQAVTLTLVWNTSLPNFTQGSAVDAAAAQPLADYVNSILVGNPINVLELNAVFIAATSFILDPNTISSMTWTVTIATVPISPVGTFYQGDAESYLTIDVTDVNISQV